MDFYQQYGDGDISPATVARLSATFPYVTPAARASETFTTTAQFHVVDLLDRLWQAQDDNSVRIDSVVFEFDGIDPPLSSHFMHEQITAIEQSWQQQVEQL